MALHAEPIFLCIYLFDFGCSGSSVLHGFSPVAASVVVVRWLLLLQNMSSGPHRRRSCGSWALEHRLSSCGTQA